jgi:hypothetical protein
VFFINNTKNNLKLVFKLREGSHDLLSLILSLSTILKIIYKIGLKPSEYRSFKKLYSEDNLIGIISEPSAS